MTITIIAAMDENQVIGIDNKLPWHLPEDLKHFRKLTQNKIIIMGRKTYESIGKALPKRHNIIITRQKNFIALNCEILTSLKQAISKHKDQELMIIGGAEIYQQALPLADKLYLTIIHHKFNGDVYFPKIDKNKWMQQEKQTLSNEKYSFSFITLVRKKKLAICHINSSTKHSTKYNITKDPWPYG